MDYTKYGERNILRCENCGGEYEITDQELHSRNTIRKRTNGPKGQKCYMKHTCTKCNEYTWNLILERTRTNPGMSNPQTRMLLIGVGIFFVLEVLYQVISYFIKIFVK